MNRTDKAPRWQITGILLVILFQTSVLAMVYLNARIPAWTGKVIRLRTVPVDPRSLFRGNYAFLRYDISRLPAKQVNQLGKPRRNQIVYVRLAPGADGTYGYGGVSFDRPEPGPLFIRGRIKKPAYTPSGHYRISYGIEAWFAPKKKAVAMERELRSQAAAEIWLTDSGRAALKRIVPNDK